MTINSLNNSGRIESARRVENTRNSDVLKHITDWSFITDYSFYFVRNPETGEETQQTRTFIFGQEQPLEQKPLPHIPQNSTLGQRPTVNPMHSIQNIINSNVGDARPTFDQRPPPAHIPQNSTLGQRPTVNPMHSIQNIINSNVGDARPTFDQRPPPAHTPQNSTLGQRPTVNPMHSIQNIINSNVGDARPTFDQRPPPLLITQNTTFGPNYSHVFEMTYDKGFINCSNSFSSSSDKKRKAVRLWTPINKETPHTNKESEKANLAPRIITQKPTSGAPQVIVLDSEEETVDYPVERAESVSKKSKTSATELPPVACFGVLFDRVL